MNNKKYTSELITEDEFWKAINVIKEKGVEYLIKNSDEIKLIGICYYGVEFYRKAYDSTIWVAPYIAMNGCGDSTFHYYRNWLIYQGREIYYNAFENPDSLLISYSKLKYQEDLQAERVNVELNENYIKLNNDTEHCLEIIIEDEYLEKFKYKCEEEMDSILVFDWDENDEDSIKRKAPKLYEKYKNNGMPSIYHRNS